MKKILISCLLFISIIIPINSLASDSRNSMNSIEVYKKYSGLINDCLQREFPMPDGKTSICFPAFGKNKDVIYNNMFRAQTLLGRVLSTKTTWVTTETGFTFQKKRTKEEIIVTYIDTSWVGCDEIEPGLVYCAFRLVQDLAKNNKLAYMMSF